MEGFQSIQSQDTPVRFQDLPDCYVRFLYSRSADSRLQDSSGEDFLAWRHRPDAFSFAVCDGVGGSFFGNVAAQYLGEKLVDFLSETGATLDRLQSPSELKELITRYLNDWRQAGQQRVDDVRLPENLPELQLAALEQLRRDHGSETIFVCGRLKLGPVQQAPDSPLTLIWMGDAQAQVFDRQARPIELNGSWTNVHRWSTKSGPNKQGAEVQVWQKSATGHPISRILAFSDGLAGSAEILHELDDAQLQELVTSIQDTPSSDDISFLDLCLKEPQPEAILPQVDSLVLSADQATLEWPAVPGATGYQVVEDTRFPLAAATAYTTGEPAWHLSSSRLAETVPYRYYRVRAKSSKRWGAWSPIIRIHFPDSTT